MRLFTALFDLAVMPIVIAHDVVMILPDVSNGDMPMGKTREQCQKIDGDLAR